MQSDRRRLLSPPQVYAYDQTATVEPWISEYTPDPAKTGNGFYPINIVSPITEWASAARLLPPSLACAAPCHTHCCTAWRPSALPVRPVIQLPFHVLTAWARGQRPAPPASTGAAGWP